MAGRGRPNPSIQVPNTRSLCTEHHRHEGQSGGYAERFVPGASHAEFIGKVFQYVVMVFVLVAAVSVLRLPAVTDFMNQVLAYLPNVIAALLIFIVAVAIAGDLTSFWVYIVGPVLGGAGAAVTYDRFIAKANAPG